MNKEEEKIEGKLYNEDGTEYKPEIKVTTPSKPTLKPKKKTNNQHFLNLWTYPQIKMQMWKI